MKFQIMFKHVAVYGFGFELSYLPGKFFHVEALIWNRSLIVGWEND